MGEHPTSQPSSTAPTSVAAKPEDCWACWVFSSSTMEGLWPQIHPNTLQAHSCVFFGCCAVPCCCCCCLFFRSTVKAHELRQKAKKDLLDQVCLWVVLSAEGVAVQLANKHGEQPHAAPCCDRATPSQRSAAASFVVCCCLAHLPTAE